MTEIRNGFQRWAELMDRLALGEALSSEDEAFCERFAQGNRAAQAELAVYRDLLVVDAQPGLETRSLVDEALRRLEAEDSERAVAEVRSLRPNRFPIWLVAGAVSAAVAAVAFVSQGRLNSRTPAASGAVAAAEAARPLTRAELVYASGEVHIEGRRATAGRVLLSEGTRIVTGDGVACVLVDSDINLCLAARSEMQLARLHAPERRVELNAGTVATRLATQPEGMQLTIAAGDVMSTAVGTAFAVERREGAPVVTTVLSGKVRVAHGEAARVVNAHERARSVANEVQVTSVSRTDEAGAWALLGPTILWHDPVSATLELSGEPAGAQATLNGQPLGRAPLSSLVPVGTHRLVVRHRDEVLLDEELYWSAGQTRSLRYEPESEPEPVAASEPRARRRAKRAADERQSTAKVAHIDEAEVEPERDGSDPLPAELLRSARRLVRDGQLRAAADTYHELRRVYPDSQEAHTVLVSLGQLQLSALHDPAEAVRLLDLYLERGGTLSEEARLTRINALRALGRRADETRAISEFLAKHPRSFEDSTLRARLAELSAVE